MDVIEGWFAYILMNNSVTTFFFVAVLLLILGLLVAVQLRNDAFDLRAIISSYVIDANGIGKYVPATDKTLLVGTWVVSTYLTIEHYSELAVGAYLTAWIFNGGIVALSKFNKLKDNDK